MTRSVRVVHRDRFYVPVEAVDGRRLRDLFEVPFQTKAHCHTNCPLATKQGRFCATCPGREASIKLWQVITTGSGRRLVAVAGGDSRLLRDLLKPGLVPEIVDRRADVPYRTPLRWTGKLRRGETVRGRRTADQAGMLGKWRNSIRAGESGGVILSPPRSGKCVTPDTLIRTERGYHRIDAMFAGRRATDGVEIIGAFGSVEAPGGARKVRGLYAKTIPEVISVDLEFGVTISGSPIHPVLAYREESDDEEPTWIKLRDLTGSEGLVVAVDTGIDPVPLGQGLDMQRAALVGGCIRYADPDRFSTGILHLSAAVLTEVPDLERALQGLCHLRPNGHDVMQDVARIPLFATWPEQLLASTRAAWHVFARSVFVESPDACVARIPDVTVGRALQAHLLGAGVACSRRIDDRGWTLLNIIDMEDWECYVHSERPDHPLVLGIERISRLPRGPHVVMDLRVPEGASFHTNGVVSHNTVIGVAGSLSERTRTFITASKIDFLRQFGRRFGELTNLKELYDRGMTPVVLVDPKGWPDGPQYGVHVLKRWKPEVSRADVVMSCAQQFLDTDHGRERMQRYLLGKFGLVEADETHQAAAAMFSRLLNRLDCRRKMGLTATIHRKDKTQDIVLKTIGPVRAKGNAASDIPRIELMETGIGAGRTMKRWNTIVKYLTSLEERNRIILRSVFADLRASKQHCVLITTVRRNHVNELVKMLNAQAAYCNQEKGENWPQEIAIAYMGGKDTNAVLNLAMSGRVRVVVAMVSMVQLGLDVARWTHVYVGVVPTSNPYNVYQLVNRVCTPYPEALANRLPPKPRPVVRIIIDTVDASIFCFVKVFKDPDYGLKAGLGPNNYVGVKLYDMAWDVLKRSQQIADAPRSYDPEDAGVKVELGRTRTGKKRRKSVWSKRGGVTSL